MKTIVIWHAWENGVDFFVLDGDYRHLDRVYVGSGTSPKEAELDNLVSDVKGNWKVSFQPNFPIEAFHQATEAPAVIVCGIIP